MEHVRKAIALLLANKGKILLMLVSSVVFIFLLFPFDDLSDLVSAQVSKLTRNQVYLQFQNMHLSLLTGPGLNFESVHVETTSLPPITAQELTISPSLGMLITQNPAGSVSARGIFRGDVDIDLKKGEKSDNGAERQRLIINARKLNLAELRELIQLPLMKGSVDLTSTALADLTFKEQPEVDVTLKIDRFELPPSTNVETPLGPLLLPDLKLSTVELKGRLSAGKFLIENGTIGKSTDELHGSIKGNIDLQIRKTDQGIFPVPGGYSLDIDLIAKKSFQDRAGTLLGLLESYKVPNPEGAQYKLRLSAESFQYAPNISALR